MKIFGYVFFDLLEEFEQWQIMNQHYRIHSISPYFSGADVKEQECNSDVRMRPSVFVVYVKEETSSGIGTA